jgi:hypothetical protein
MAIIAIGFLLLLANFIYQIAICHHIYVRRWRYWIHHAGRLPHFFRLNIGMFSHSPNATICETAYLLNQTDPLPLFRLGGPRSMAAAWNSDKASVLWPIPSGYVIEQKVLLVVRIMADSRLLAAGLYLCRFLCGRLFHRRRAGSSLGPSFCRR